MCPVDVPCAKPLELAVTCKASGAVPLIGETVSHGESDDVVKLRTPPPELATLMEPTADCPCGALKGRVAGITPSTGVAGAIPTRYADIGQAVEASPEVQVAGSCVRPVCELFSAVHGPLLRLRNSNVPLLAPRTAIQYG